VSPQQKPNPPPRTRKDPWGRPALGLGALFLFAVALTRGDDLHSFFLFGMGILLLILFAFFSKISGTLGIGKFQIPIIGDQPHPVEQDRSDSRPESEDSHRPSITEFEKAARNPATRRNRG
jgi:hypothetical protein